VQIVCKELVFAVRLCQSHLEHNLLSFCKKQERCKACCSKYSSATARKKLGTNFPMYTKDVSNEILDHNINTLYRVYLKYLEKFQESFLYNKTGKDVHIIILLQMVFRGRPPSTFARSQSSRFLFMGVLKKTPNFPAQIQNKMDVHKSIFVPVKPFTTDPEPFKLHDKMCPNVH
jgi:hypothetical protein